MPPDRFDCPRAAAADPSDHIVGVRSYCAPCEFGRVRETRRYTVAVRVDRLDDGILRGLDAVNEIGTPFAQTG